MSDTPLPLALYVHYPWCVRKCPYCDFFSKACGRDRSRDERYFRALLEDYEAQRRYLCGRKILSVYFGGGTPSLCPPDLIGDFLSKIRPDLTADCEISMEANPGTVDKKSLELFKQAGVNRLSLGVQSFDDESLKALGRIHDGAQARQALEAAFAAGFLNVNCDIMHGLPGQDVRRALDDLKIACSYPLTHLSWYELTLEEGTPFGFRPPVLPDEDTLADIEELGFLVMSDHGFAHYEVSAFARNGLKCAHNLNYWRFGDYLGLGAGASGKVFFKGRTLRRACPEDPEAYIQGSRGAYHETAKHSLPFEFMLNRLRLFEDFKKSDFEKAAALPFFAVEGTLRQCEEEGLITLHEDSVAVTAFGRRMLNDVLEKFL